MRSYLTRVNNREPAFLAYWADLGMLKKASKARLIGMIRLAQGFGKNKAGPRDELRARFICQRQAFFSVLAGIQFQLLLAAKSGHAATIRL